MKVYFIIGEDSAEGEFVARKLVPTDNYGGYNEGDVLMYIDHEVAHRVCEDMNRPPGRMTESFCKFKVREQEL